jgi:hypothetical protein
MRIELRALREGVSEAALVPCRSACERTESCCNIEIDLCATRKERWLVANLECRHQLHLLRVESPVQLEVRQKQTCGHLLALGRGAAT